ncbi:MAG: hypothetical protein U0517_03125 [Candidatus Andersenbacteria bacterium]
MTRLALIYKELLSCTGQDEVAHFIGTTEATAILHKLTGACGIPTGEFILAFNEAWNRNRIGREANYLLLNKETGDFCKDRTTPMWFTLRWLGEVLGQLPEAF